MMAKGHGIADLPNSHEPSWESGTLCPHNRQLSLHRRFYDEFTSSDQWSNRCFPPIQYPINMMAGSYGQESPDPVKEPKKPRWVKIVAAAVGACVLLAIIAYFALNSDSEYVMAIESLINKLNQFSTTPPTIEERTAFLNELEEYNTKFGGKLMQDAEKYNEAFNAAQLNYFTAHKAQFVEVFSIYEKMDVLWDRHTLIRKWPKDVQIEFLKLSGLATVIALQHVCLPMDCVIMKTKYERRFNDFPDISGAINHLLCRLKFATRPEIIVLKREWDLECEHRQHPVTWPVWDLIVKVDDWFEAHLPVHYGHDWDTIAF